MRDLVAETLDFLAVAHGRPRPAAGYLELEVRCCCTPKRLYGYMTLPERFVHRGAALIFQQKCRIATDIMGDYNAPPAEAESQIRLVVEELGEYDNGMHRRRIALKADDDSRTPEQKLAILRTVWGFQEA